MTLLRFALVMTVGLGSACGDEDDGPAEQQIEPPPPMPEQPWELEASPWVRIDLKKDGDTVTLIDAKRVVSPPTIPMLEGDHMAIAYAGGAITDAVALAFPTTLYSEGFDQDGNIHAENEELVQSTTAVWLADDPALERIDIVASSGEVVLTVTPDAFVRYVPPVSRITTSEFESMYPWVDILDRDFAMYLPEDLLMRAEAFDQPTEEHIELLAEAFAAMSEISRRSVTTVAFAQLPNEGVTMAGGGCSVLLARAWVSSMIINADALGPNVAACNPEPARESLVSMIAHEAAHSVTWLIEFERDPEILGMYPPEAQAIAHQTVQRYALQSGLHGVWAGLHANGESNGLAGAYRGDDWIRITDPFIKSFATNYGGYDVREDIAEYVRAVQAPHATPSQFCQTLSGHGELTREVAVQYAKLLLAHYAGLIDDERFDACRGPLEISATPGIHLEDLSLTRDLRSGVADQDGGHFFVVLATGPNEYSALLRVLAPTDRPLGLHRLDDVWWTTFGLPINGFFLANESDELNSLARTAYTGLVLVTEATPERAEGVVFFLGLQDALGRPTSMNELVPFVIEN